MPRRLDDYSFDASGFGDLVRGSDNRVSTPFGDIGYRKGIFDKNPYDKEGNLLPETKAGRQIQGNFKLKEKGAALALAQYNQMGDADSARVINQRASEIQALAKARGEEITLDQARQIAVQNNFTDNILKQKQSEHSLSMQTPANLAAMEQLTADRAGRVFKSNSDANVARNEYGVAQTAARGLPYQIALAENELAQGANSARLTNSQALAALLPGLSPSGNVIIDEKTGKITDAITPSATKVISTEGGMSPDGKTFYPKSQVMQQTDPSIKRSMFSSFTPGQVIPTESQESQESQDAQGLPTLPSFPVSKPMGATTAPNGLNRIGPMDAVGINNSYKRIMPQPVPDGGEFENIFRQSLSSPGLNPTVYIDKAREAIGQEAATALGLKAENIGDSVLKWPRPNIFGDQDQMRKFDGLNPLLRESAYSNAVRRLGLRLDPKF